MHTPAYHYAAWSAVPCPFVSASIPSQAWRHLWRGRAFQSRIYSVERCRDNQDPGLVRFQVQWPTGETETVATLESTPALRLPGLLHDGVSVHGPSMAVMRVDQTVISLVASGLPKPRPPIVCRLCQVADLTMA